MKIDINYDGLLEIIHESDIRRKKKRVDHH